MKRRVFIALVAGAMACPRAGLTQQPTKVYRIAVVNPSFPVSQMTEAEPNWRALFQELRLGDAARETTSIDPKFGS
jgi:hypothetical protein